MIESGPIYSHTVESLTKSMASTRDTLEIYTPSCLSPELRKLTINRKSMDEKGLRQSKKVRRNLEVKEEETPNKRRGRKPSTPIKTTRGGDRKITDMKTPKQRRGDRGNSNRKMDANMGSGGCPEKSHGTNDYTQLELSRYEILPYNSKPKGSRVVL